MSRLRSSKVHIWPLLVILVITGVVDVNGGPTTGWPNASLPSPTQPLESVNPASYDDVPPASGMSTISTIEAFGEESGMPEFPYQEGNVTMVNWLDAEDNATEQVEELGVLTPTPLSNVTDTNAGNVSETEMPSEANDTKVSPLTNGLTSLKPFTNVTEDDIRGYGSEQTTDAAVTQEQVASATSTKTSQELESDVVTTMTSLLAGVSGTELPTSFTSVQTTTIEPNEPLKSTWFILILDGNCSLVFSKGIMEEDFKAEVLEAVAPWLKASVDNLTIGQNACPTNDKIHMNLTLCQQLGKGNISEQLNAMEESAEPLLEMHGEPFYVYEIVTVDGYLSREPKIPTDLRHSDVELLIYITVGSICAFLLALAVVLLLCKYCECRDQKPFDFGDAPNLNMRLEDYTLTRIPRPKLGYVDYYRGLTQRYCPLDDKMTTSPNGMVQPFDTSVVPLEDIQGLEARSAPVLGFRDCHDGVIVRPTDIQRFSRVCRPLGRSVPSSASSYLDGDVDGFYIRSTENLNQWPKEDQYVDKGVDNPNFQ